MSKTKIIYLVVASFVCLIIITCGILYFIQQQKLSVSYIISQSKGPEDWEETVCTNEDCDDSYQVKAKKYKYTGSPFFDEIVEIDEYSGNTKQYAFRTSTGWNNIQNIEIGRIELPYADKNSSVKCSYNYRGEAAWQPCTEKKFIKSFEDIYTIKEEKGKKFEDTAKEIENLKKDCESNKINYFECLTEYSKLEREAKKLLRELKNATIQLNN